MKRKRHKIHSQEIRVTRVNPLAHLLLRAGILILLLCLPMVGYLYALSQLGDRERDLAARNDELTVEVRDLAARLAEVDQESMNLRVAGSMDAESIDQLRQQISSWRERNELLESQVNFYLSLMDPGASNDGVFIQMAELFATEEPDLFRYSVLLGQKAGNHQRVTGRLEMRMVSLRDDVNLTLPLADVVAGSERLALGFRFFQQLEGHVRIPPDSEPTAWLLDVHIAGRGLAYSARYDWPTN